MVTKRTTLPVRPVPRQVQQEDSFWIIVAILAVISFTGSFLFVYMMTSQVDVKDVQTVPRPSLLPTVAPTVMDLSLPRPGASAPAATAPSGANQQGVQPSASAAAPGDPAAAASPAVQPTAAPTAAASPSIAPSASPPSAAQPRARGTVYRVQVGAFGVRQEAEQAAQQLLASGFSALLVAEGNEYRLQMGSFNDQERALALAEKLMASGQPVRIKKGTE